MGDLRTSEIVSIVYFAAIACLAWVSPAGGSARAAASAGAATIALSVLVVPSLAALLPAQSATLRDWSPLPLLLLSYWLPRRLVSRPVAALEDRLVAWDRRLFASAWGRAVVRSPRAVREALEAAYLAVYPMVPAALALVIAGGRRDQVDWFWSVVLTSEYLCYVWLPLLPTRPPRELESVPPYGGAHTAVRRLNVWILRHASNRWNTFPSGHVAGAAACALAVTAVLPATGAALGVLAGLIAVASVAGRYHYAADAAAGTLVAGAAFLLFLLQ